MFVIGNSPTRESEEKIIMESITNFFNFNTLITPYIIGFIYIFGAVVVPFIVIYYFKKYRLHINSSRYRLYLFVSFVIL